ncbi:flagellar protein FlaG [Pseudomonas plecoglossicida]|uniref:Flagellar biosynthesis protein FlaG n=1 Tax=Pseudomonas plecoglossicida TaxID=70775 RepID=A0AAD0R1P0_PSEDL|nr:flagellar protein FlaG [Pseudomonas plecoglossicida]AXM98552.1 flagellar biosynthesis protein FlaG [Pseudomonas plecoglossicida]EPB95147.1 flagellar protein FlaG protein [Pseudomonas plecoglossicida NB2011]QLB54696.1 flagellar protein FlaG [Pseudomonas plecoglossicida]GLR34772.1 flagellar protein FlaG [Pseudomonas plecoglossicida]
MDMSVKLNLSYPAARATESVADKPVARSADAPRGSDTLEPKAVSAAEKGTDSEKVRNAVSQIEKFLSSTRRNLEFSTDEESGKIVVKVIASETGELIRQLPSEEALRIAHSLSDVNSLLFDAKV